MPQSGPDAEHWETVYLTKAVDGVSWYSPHLLRSWQLLDSLELSAATRIIDVGGGASTFVDDALARGFHNVTVLDLAESALGAARARLGDLAERASWVAGDVTKVELGADSFDVWHDRAVFHFLTDPHDQARYMAALDRALAPGGYVVMATFGPNGPDRCSNLATLRLSGEELFSRFPAGFEKLSVTQDVHTTPWGATQEFSYLLAKRC
jgi:SAM-dependent methyltransferase